VRQPWTPGHFQDEEVQTESDQHMGNAVTIIPDVVIDR